jgi:ELWxxDGT repeat protein
MPRSKLVAVATGVAAAALTFTALNSRADTGPALIADVNGGPSGSNPNQFVSVNGVVLFQAQDSVHGVELWRTDGTPAGTVLVKDIWPGVNNSRPSGLKVAGSNVWFSSDDGTHGTEIWKSDGTEAGTVMVKDLAPGSMFSDISSITAAGSLVYFVSTVLPDSGFRLWKSDGTDAGTVGIMDFPGYSYGQPTVDHLVPVGSELFFVANDNVNGTELWRTDGTAAGTQMVTDIWPGAGGSNPANLTVVGSRLFLTATDPVNGYSLWVTDGTAVGTSLVHSFAGEAYAVTISSAVDLNGRLLFSTSKNDVWASDGTPAGTTSLVSFFPYGSYVPAFQLLDGVAYFIGEVDGHWNRELWKTDGTAGGTGSLKGLGNGSSFWTQVIGSSFYFTYPNVSNGTYELWRIKAGELAFVRDLPAQSYGYGQGVNLQGDWIFAGSDQVYGGEPWKAPIEEAGSPFATLDVDTLSFGGESMNTTGQPVSFTLTNRGQVPVQVLGIDVPAGFQVVSQCGVIAVNGACTVWLSFTPSSAGNVIGVATIRTDAGTYSIALSGTGEKSLVTHYYESILRRVPDSAGKTFWEGEASRVTSIGANVNETWFAMAMTFYFSPEYTAFNRSQTEYLRDLYNTFFNRPADDAGLAYWSSQMDAGMSREAALTSFMFSQEFSNFTTAVFGTSTVGPEANMVMDFYRGLLSRLPDSAGFSYYDGKFRFAQCSFGVGNPNTVVSVAEEMSKAFLSSTEYLSRNRSDAQYIADLYNAFMRRGPDVDGYNFYVGQLGGGHLTREALRQIFVSSPEFSARVAQVMAAGCH